MKGNRQSAIGNSKEGDKRKSSSLLPIADCLLPVLWYWLPPILWISAISFFSTDNFSGENTGSFFYNVFHYIIPSLSKEQFAPVHYLIRKSGHFTEYFILILLLVRAFRAGSLEDIDKRWSRMLYSLLIASIYSLLDEYHQTFTATRIGSIYDSMTDISGAITAILFLIIYKDDRGGLRQLWGRDR